MHKTIMTAIQTGSTGKKIISNGGNIMKKKLLTISLMIALGSVTITSFAPVNVYAEQKFGSSGGSGGGSSGGDGESSGGSSDDGSSGGGGEQVDEAAAAWFNEQARLKAEQDAAMAALLLQQQQQNAAVKSGTKKKAVSKPKEEDGSSVSDEINAMKEKAASYANSEFAQDSSDDGIKNPNETAIVTDLETTTDAPEVYESDSDDKDSQDAIATSKDAAISKYIIDSLHADASTVTKGAEEKQTSSPMVQTGVLSKTSKNALIAVLCVVLAVILIIGLVVIFIKKGYWNVISVDEDLELGGSMP